MATWSKRWSNSAARQRTRMVANAVTAAGLFLANFWNEPRDKDDPKFKMFGVIQEAAGFVASFGFTVYEYFASRAEARDLFADYIREEKGLPSGGKVSFSDVASSDNQLLTSATKLLGRNALLGFITDLPFIVPTIIREVTHRMDPEREESRLLKPGVGAIAGVGSKAGYTIYRQNADKPNSVDALMMLRRVMFDKESFEPVTANQVLMVYQRFAVEHNMPTLNGPSDAAMAVFERIAKYLDFTRHHERDHPDVPQQVKFSLPELVYLIGTGKLDINNLQNTEAWLEVLSHGDIKMAREIEKKITPQDNSALMSAAVELHNDYEARKAAHDKAIAAEGKDPKANGAFPADPGGCPSGKLGEICNKKRAAADPAVESAPTKSYASQQTQGTTTPASILQQKIAAHDAQATRA
ncbi:MAG: hypothetical protein IT567_06405 [Alphaproteobacteria bacterium]|nr:hypothetical protein [Alphaproteobacteria bacterium]